MTEVSPEGSAKRRAVKDFGKDVSNDHYSIFGRRRVLLQGAAVGAGLLALGFAKDKVLPGIKNHLPKDSGGQEQAGTKAEWQARKAQWESGTSLEDQALKRADAEGLAREYWEHFYPGIDPEFTTFLQGLPDHSADWDTFRSTSPWQNRKDAPGSSRREFVDQGAVFPGGTFRFLEDDFPAAILLTQSFKDSGVEHEILDLVFNPDKTVRKTGFSEQELQAIRSMSPAEMQSLAEGVLIQPPDRWTRNQSAVVGQDYYISGEVQKGNKIVVYSVFPKGHMQVLTYTQR